MEASILIVTRNRPEELRFTLDKLKAIINPSIHEVLVFIDGCQLTLSLVTEYPWIKWTISKQPLSASPARQQLYRLAKGEVLIGLDDDAHPLSAGFINAVKTRFSESEKLGVIAFQEIRGVYDSDHDAIKRIKKGPAFITNDFVGCGFAIRKSVYDATRGFPVWIDIYGEEPSVAIEVQNLGYEILYDYDIAVNHRIDPEKRRLSGRNYFRFEHQLQNELRFFTVYYKKPLKRIARLLFHNFKKYSLKDFKYFRIYVKVLFQFIMKLPYILKFRCPVKKETIENKNQVQGLHY